MALFSVKSSPAMWFKNLQIYRLPAPWAMNAEQLEPLLLPQAFVECSSADVQTQGWVPPLQNGGLVYTSNQQMLLQLRIEKKLLPTSVVNQVAKVRAQELADQQGFKPGKKQMRELKENVFDELLPRAFSIQSHTKVWIDPVNGWLVIDAAAPAKADEIIKLLLKAVDKLPVAGLSVVSSPVAEMTDWISSDEAPAGFTVDQDTELRASGESKAAVRYVRHTLEAEDVRRHIAAGKQCTRLAMTWADRISFTLTEALAVKSIKPLDVLKETDSSTMGEEERFQSDFVLMCGELNKMMTNLVEALGGESK